jgi:hypothetical protein
VAEAEDEDEEERVVMTVAVAEIREGGDGRGEGEMGACGRFGLAVEWTGQGIEEWGSSGGGFGPGQTGRLARFLPARKPESSTAQGSPKSRGRSVQVVLLHPSSLPVR